MKNSIKKITELLPAGLSEGTVRKIASLIQEAIQEELDEKLETLAVRTSALFRSKIEDLKEHAVKELELTDDSYRDLELMKYLKGLFAVEVGAVDNDFAAKTVMEEAAEISNGAAMLSEQLDETLKENVKLEKTLHLMEAELEREREKSRLLSEKVKTVKSTKTAAEAILEDFKTPGVARAIKGKSDAQIKSQDGDVIGDRNPLISETFLRLIK